MLHASILGCRVDAIGIEDAVRTIVDLTRGDGASLVVTLGTEMVVRAQTDERFRRVLNDAALSLCDTVGVMYAARLHGVHIPERVTGVELIEPLCAALAREGSSIYLLGAKGDTAERVGTILAQRYPGLRIAGTRDGYFTPADDAEVACAVRESGADVIFVGLGSPRQECWIADNVGKTGCRVGIGVGGSLDVLGGNVPRAPERWRRLNLEWLYRLMSQPSRWRRQLALPHFVWLALGELLLAKRRRT